MRKPCFVNSLLITTFLLIAHFTSSQFTLIYAACVPSGTPSDDTIICTYFDDGVQALDGDDSVLIKNGADITTYTDYKNFVTSVSGGSGSDRVINEGGITVKRSLVFGQTLTAYGIDGGVNDTGTETIINALNGNINVTADTFVSTDELTASSIAIGIRASNTSNIIENLGTITVKSYAKSDPGNLVPFDEAEGHAKGEAYGLLINADGNSIITNMGTIIVTNELTADANAETIINTEATPTINSSQLGGIKTGSGDDEILNSGSGYISLQFIAVAEADAVSPCIPNPWTGCFPVAGSAKSTAKIESSYVYIVDAGEGTNKIENNGLLNLSIDAFAESDSVVATFLSPNCDATSKIKDLLVYGLKAGDGQNTITNTGTISLGVTEMRAESDATAPEDGDTVAEVSANFYGIQTGAGYSNILNDETGVISVQAKATADANSNTLISASAKATSTVNAFGIDVGYDPHGEGIYSRDITNWGSIKVRAEATANVDASANASSDANSLAIGVQGGPGIETLHNFGFIQAEEVENGTSRIGTAIRLRGGNDQLFLHPGSETLGNINLGAGNNLLVMDGDATVIGDIELSQISTDYDSVVLRHSGEFLGQIIGVDYLLKEQQGAFRIGELTMFYGSNPLSIEVDEGVLSIVSPPSMSPGAELHIRINPNGSENKLNVETGVLSLDGDLYMTHSPGLFLNGDTFEIVTAPSIEGIFIKQNLPDATPLLNFSVVQEPAVVEVVALAKPFSSVSENRVERAVGNYLDVIAPTASGDLWDVLAEFQQLTTAEFESAFSSLSPDSFDNATLTSYSVAKAANQNIQQRLTSRRLLDVQGGKGQDVGLRHQEPVRLAYNSDDGDLTGLLQGVSDYGKQSRHGIWLDAYGRWGDKDDRSRNNWNQGGYTGFDFNVYGFNLGFDQEITNRFLAGLSVGYAKTNIDLDNNAGDGEIDSVMLTLYGEYRREYAYLDGVLAYGLNDYDNKRNLIIGDDRRTARSDHDGDLFSGYLESGFPISRGRWQVEPFISLQYIHLDEESFSETGADDINMKINGRKTESLVSEAGIRAVYIAQKESGRLLSDIGVAWVHDYDIDDRVITASYAGAPSAAFSVKGQDIESDGAAVGLGLTFQNNNGLTTSVRLDTEIRDNYYDAGIMGEISYAF